jgi:hypothetical protein
MAERRGLTPVALFQERLDTFRDGVDVELAGDPSPACCDAIQACLFVNKEPVKFATELSLVSEWNEDRSGRADRFANGRDVDRQSAF